MIWSVIRTPVATVSISVLISGPTAVHQTAEFAETATSQIAHQTVVVPK